MKQITMDFETYEKELNDLRDQWERIGKSKMLNFFEENLIILIRGDIVPKNRSFGMTKINEDYYLETALDFMIKLVDETLGIKKAPSQSSS